MSATPEHSRPRLAERRDGAARAWRWLREHAVIIIAVLVVIYLLIPIAVIFVFSFNNPAGPLQLHLGRLHPEALEATSSAIPELNEALLDLDQAGAAGDGDLDHHRDDDGARPGPPPVLRPARRRTS